MLDSLEVNEAQAEAIVALGIEFEVYSEDMPSSKQDKIEAAHGIVSFGLDAWVDDGVTPDSDDEDTAEAGEQIAAIFKIAGIKVAKNNKITYGKAASAATIAKVLEEYEIELDSSDEDEDEDDDNAADETAFDVNDIIEGYDELSAVTKIKKIKALKLDPEEDEDHNTIITLLEFEEEQDKPASRVMSLLEEMLGDEEDEDAEDDEDESEDDDTADDSDEDEDEDEADEDEGDDEPLTEKQLQKMEKEELAEIYEELEIEDPPFPKRFTDAGKKRVIEAILAAQGEDEDNDVDDEGDEVDEPWEGYDDAKLASIKEVINDDERTVEELEYVLEYEESADEPRSSIVKLVKSRIAELSEEDEDEDEPEEKPARRGRGKAKTTDPDDSDDVDEAVARDDARDKKRGAKKGKKTAAYEVVYVIDDEEYVSSIDGVHSAAGIVADALAAGATEVSIKG